MALLQPHDVAVGEPERAARSAPIAPDAPVWLSITTGWPVARASCSATRRRATSEALPAASGVMNVMLRFG